MDENAKPLVAIIMGSQGDWQAMQRSDQVLTEFDVPHECRVMSAHRSPQLVLEYVAGAEGRGIEVIIAGAGLAAHLAGVAASHTVLPVLGVPMEGSSLGGLDALLSTAQMPGGVPVGTLGIGSTGAKNAALLAVAILGTSRPKLRDKLRHFREKQARQIADTFLPPSNSPET